MKFEIINLQNDRLLSSPESSQQLEDELNRLIKIEQFPWNDLAIYLKDEE